MGGIPVKESHMQLLAAALCGTAGAVWLILLNALCAVIWRVACAAQIFYWRRGK